MARIPSYDQQTGTIVPSVPTLQTAKAVPDAYGANVWKANESIGKAVGDIGEALSKHLEEKKRKKDEAFTATLNTNYRLNIQDKLYNDKMEKVKINGKDVERPVGIFNRSLQQSDGSTVEFDQYYHDLREKYVSSAPTEELAVKLGQEMDSQYLPYREAIIKHESKQGKQVLINSQQANLSQQIHDAAAINDPVQLLNAINTAKDTQASLNEITGVDEETAQNTLKDRAGDIVAKAVQSTLMATGDLEKAQQMLDVAEEDIHADRYEKLSESLVSGVERIEKQKDLIATQKQISNETNLLTSFANGELDWMQVDDIARDVRDGNIRDRFANALIDVIETKGTYEPNEDENKNYPKFVEAVYNAGSQEDLQKTLIGVLKDNKNMSQDKMSILINEAVKRGKNLPVRSNELNPGEGQKVNIQQNESDAGAKAVLYFGRKSGLSNSEIAYTYQNYANALNEGKTPMEAYQIATKQHAITKNPSLMQIPTEGRMMIDANGNKAIVFPDGSFKEVGTGSSGSGSTATQKGKKENGVQSGNSR